MVQPLGDTILFAVEQHPLFGTFLFVLGDAPLLELLPLLLSRELFLDGAQKLALVELGLVGELVDRQLAALVI